MLQYFLEGLSNHTGYPVFKLIRKNIWQVYDTLTSQVFINNKTHTHAGLGLNAWVIVDSFVK